MKKNESSKASELTSSASEENEKEKKKARGESKTGKLKALYKVDATNLKMADRNRRILISAVIFSAEIALIFLTSLFLEIYGLIIMFVLIVFFLPAPIVLAPSKYKITKQGIIFNGEKVFQLKKNYRVKENPSRNFVSVRERKGEVAKLYTTEPEKVMRILNKLITSEKK